MAMRFRPAYISVINRRASAEAVIGPAVQAKRLQAHQQDHDPATPPVEIEPVPERCSPSRVRYAAPNYGRALDRCAPFRPGGDCDGRLQRDHDTIAAKHKTKSGT